MGIPFFFLILALAGVILLAVTMAYFYVYKRKINQMLKSPKEQHTAMMAPHKLAIITTIVLLLCISFISYFVGYKAAYDDYEHGLSQSQTTFETFYAEIIKIEDNQITVDGIDINDVKYRGQFTLEIYGETQIGWHESPIVFSDLKEGHIISITLAAPSGTVDTSTEVITDIASIQVLSDQ